MGPRHRMEFRTCVGRWLLLRDVALNRRSCYKVFGVALKGKQGTPTEFCGLPCFCDTLSHLVKPAPCPSIQPAPLALQVGTRCASPHAKFMFPIPSKQSENSAPFSALGTPSSCLSPVSGPTLHDTQSNWIKWCLGSNTESQVLKWSISGWDCPLLTFIYPGFDCGSTWLN